MAAFQRHFGQAQHMRVQIRLTARKSDFNFMIIHLVNFVEIWSHIFGREINEMVGGRAALDITIGAFNIAQ